VLTADGATTLTPAAATADTDAKLTLGGDALTLTSGALAVAEDAELVLGKKLTVKGTLDVAGTISTDDISNVVASGTGTAKTTGDGKVVVGSGDDTATLTKATVAEESSKPVLTLADGGAITTAGSGELEFGATTFSGVGAWTASVSADDSDNITGVKITTDTAGATIAAVASASPATGTATLTASGASPTITQAAGAGNALTIGANTVIALGGTDSSTPVGKISLKQGSDAGKLALSEATSIIYTLAAKTDGTAYSTLTSLGSFVTGSTITKDEVFQVSNKLTKLTGKTGGASITAAISGSGTDDIGSTTATVGS
jgi:hypothetical protein